MSYSLIKFQDISSIQTYCFIFLHYICNIFLYFIISDILIYLHIFLLLFLNSPLPPVFSSLLLQNPFQFFLYFSFLSVYFFFNIFIIYHRSRGLLRSERVARLQQLVDRGLLSWAFPEPYKKGSDVIICYFESCLHFFFVFNCFVLNYVLLYCTKLYYFVLHCNILHCIELY